MQRSGETRRRHAIAVTAMTVLALAGSATSSAVAQSSGAAPATPIIRAMLDSSAAAWNRGDVRGHLATNADSIEFMTRQGPVVGNATVIKMMTEHYFRDGKPIQQLRFDHVTVRPLGERFALAVGQFILSGGGLEDQSGWFSTIWEHRPEGWRVIHDHSS